MTEEHPYRLDPYLTEAEGRVLATPEGRVRLDRSLFYPAGGGQPGDAGRIAFAGGRAPASTARVHPRARRFRPRRTSRPARGPAPRTRP